MIDAVGEPLCSSPRFEASIFVVKNASKLCHTSQGKRIPTLLFYLLPITKCLRIRRREAF